MLFESPMNKLRIVFIGTPEFAVPSLDILTESGYNVVGVITAPDKPAGRGQKIVQSAVKKYAVENGLKVMQPTNLKDENFLQELKSLNANLQIVIAFRMLPEAVWNMLALGTFNLHASLLPQYRGAAPINWVIINGEKETGLTTFFLQHKIDTGKIIFQEKIRIGENETAGVLHDRLMEMGSTLVLKTVKSIETGNCPQIDQSKLVSIKTDLKKAPKIFKNTCKIDWNKNINSIYNFIRGLSPYPAAFTELHSSGGKTLQIKVITVQKETIDHNVVSGSIVSNGKSLKIAAADGFIAISELQKAGKKRMKTEEFLRGFPLNEKWKAI